MRKIAEESKPRGISPDEANSYMDKINEIENKLWYAVDSVDSGNDYAAHDAIVEAIDMLNGDIWNYFLHIWRDASRKAMKKKAWWSAGFTLEQLLSAVAPNTDIEIYNYVDRYNRLFHGDIADAKAWLRGEGSEYAIQGVCLVQTNDNYLLTIGIND